MTRRLTRDLRSKIPVLQEAYGSVRPTQRLFNSQFAINSAPTRRTIYAVHRRFMATGAVADTQQSGRSRA